MIGGACPHSAEPHEAVISAMVYRWQGRIEQPGDGEARSVQEAAGDRCFETTNPYDVAVPATASSYATRPAIGVRIACGSQRELRPSVSEMTLLAPQFPR